MSQLCWLLDATRNDPYNPTITTLENPFDEIPPGILEPYMPVADANAANLPETRPSIITLSDNRAAILGELKARWILRCRATRSPSCISTDWE